MWHEKLIADPALAQSAAALRFAGHILHKYRVRARVHRAFASEDRASTRNLGARPAASARPARDPGLASAPGRTGAGNRTLRPC